VRLRDALANRQGGGRLPKNSATIRAITRSTSLTDTVTKGLPMINTLSFGVG